MALDVELVEELVEELVVTFTAGVEGFETAMIGRTVGLGASFCKVLVLN